MATGPQRSGQNRLERHARIIGRSAMTKLRNYFLAGILITAPITITVWLAVQIIEFFDSTVRNLIPAAYNPEHYLPFSIPGLGLVMFVVGLTVIGALTAGFLGRSITRTAEHILNRMPVIRTVYNALKQIFETVLQKQSSAFRKVVLIEYPRRGIWCLGFLSGTTEGEVQNLTDEQLLNVFLPTTPNPTSGFLLFLPKKDVVILSMTVEEGIKMVVSGGLVTPPDMRPKATQETPLIKVAESTGRVAGDEAFAEELRKRHG